MLTDAEFAFVLKCCTPTDKDDPLTALKCEVVKQAASIYKVPLPDGLVEADIHPTSNIWLSAVLQYIVYADYYRKQCGPDGSGLLPEAVDNDFDRLEQDVGEYLSNIEYAAEQKASKAA